jgi:hypothetical protein
MGEFFAFRLNKLKILNNQEWGPGEVKLLSFITGQDGGLPILENLQRTTSVKKKKQIIQNATQTVLASKVLMQVDHVKDGHQMTFGDTGYALWTTDKIPMSFNWSLLAFEIDEDINTLGKNIDTIVKSDAFNGFAANLLTILGAATNPAAVAGVAIAKFAFGIIAEAMLENKDDQIGVAYQSFNRFEHYPHGERKKDDVPDLSNNIFIDYSIFGTTY